MSTELSYTKKLRQKAKNQFRIGGKFASRPDSNAIRKRAAQIWQARSKNNIPGDHLSDWLQAERELSNR